MRLLRTIKLSRATAVVLALALALTLVGTAIAATTTRTARTLTQLKVVHGTSATVTHSTAFADVPGASTTITVARNTRAVVLARFSAESACSGAAGWCPVRILINGTEADPVVGADFAFDSSDANNDTASSWESHAMERSRVYFAPGTYTVKVQQAVTNASIALGSTTGPSPSRPSPSDGCGRPGAAEAEQMPLPRLAASMPGRRHKASA